MTPFFVAFFGIYLFLWGVDVLLNYGMRDV